MCHRQKKKKHLCVDNKDVELLFFTWNDTADVLPYFRLKHNLSPIVFPQKLVGNVNSEAVVQNRLSHPVRTRFLRFVPLSWNPSGWMGLRVEVYGCSYSEETHTHSLFYLS